MYGCNMVLVTRLYIKFLIPYTPFKKEKHIMYAMIIMRLVL